MSKKITSTGSTEVLYHYSCKERLFEILSSGYLKLTCSDIIMPDGTQRTELKAAAYHPVVWLTDSLSAENMGLDGSAYNKKAIRFTVRKTADMKKWSEWEPQKEMNARWKSAYRKNRNWSSWYVSEQAIPLADVLKIENVLDGTIYLDREKEG